jgi:hypothetical protein
MRIGCYCGNVLRDQAEYIPYKGHFIADQDYDNLFEEIEKQLKPIWNRSASSPSGINPRELFGSMLSEVIFSYERTLYQCSNCGRICVIDPDDPRYLQWFKPEGENWKKVLVSINGEGSKPWRRNVVGHWDPSRSKGRLWYDPRVGEKGGFETCSDWNSLQNRYFELFELFKAEKQLVGARLGVGNEGEAIQDVHTWSSRQDK